MASEMGNRIKQLRLEHQLTQTELGKRIGVGKSAIVKYEKGEVENMPRSRIQKLADVFGVSPTYLMGFDNWDEEQLASDVELIERVQARWGSGITRLMEYYLQLNQFAQSKVNDYALDLIENPKNSYKNGVGSRSVQDANGNLEPHENQ